MSKFSNFYIQLFVLLLNANLSAQLASDTLYITETQSFKISNIINADTAAPEGRVYVMDRGAIYYVDGTLKLNSSRKFMAKGDAGERPPVLAKPIKTDCGPDLWFFEMNKEGMTLDLENIYIISMTQDGDKVGCGEERLLPWQKIQL